MQGEDRHLQAEGRSLRGTSPACSLILDFQPPELWENRFLLLKPPSRWYPVMAAWQTKARGTGSGTWSQQGSSFNTTLNSESFIWALWQPRASARSVGVTRGGAMNTFCLLSTFPHTRPPWFARSLWQRDWLEMLSLASVMAQIDQGWARKRIRKIRSLGNPPPA